MILFHYLIKNDFSFIQKYLNKLFKYSPLFKEYLKKYSVNKRKEQPKRVYLAYKKQIIII